MIDMRDETRNEHEIERVFANGLIGDMDVAALGIAGFGQHRGPFGLGGRVDAANVSTGRGQRLNFTGFVVGSFARRVPRRANERSAS